MENSLTNNNQELNGQNIPQDKAQISSSSPEENSFPQFFSVANLKKRFSTPINVNGIGSEPNRTFKRYKSERIKKFLSNKDDDNNNKKKLGTIKEIVLDDQNENMVDNNPKNRFKVKEGKKNKEEKKKKLNIIEELRKFDRKQQISMEEYINNKKQKKFEYAYRRSLKNNYKKLNSFNNDINNGLLSQENNNEENEYNTPAEKDMNDSEMIIEKEEMKYPYKTELKKRNDSDEFDKLKQKYFSKNIFSSRFPNSEYKVKYLNNYFNKDSVVRNLFGQYNENKEIPQEKNNNSINNNNNISPKLIYKNNNLSQNNINSEIKNSNNRYNNNNDNNNNINNDNEQSLNSNKNSLIKSYKYSSYKYNYNDNNEIENNYNKVFNSINERLYKNQLKKKYSNVSNFNLIKSPSSDKIRTNVNFYNSALDKNKSYNFFSGQSNKNNNRYDYNNFKLNFNFFSKKFEY